MPTVIGQASNPNEIGVTGESLQFEGIRGISHAENHGGVVGINDSQTDGAGAGVFGESKKGEGVRGISHSRFHGGVVGTCDNEGAGVFGESTNGEGVRGVSHSAAHAAVVGTNDNPAGIGIFGKGGRLAGRFEGDVEVTGDIRLVNADCAEDFDIAAAELIEPGTVMIVGEEGVLRQSDESYDKRVAGVISGAGDLKPGIVLDKKHARLNRKPLALMGKVCCKVDASYAPVQVGDLLTTSPTPGYAMKADDPLRAFGCVIGKALRSLPSGQGLIPVLVALQ
jgi:hypothetical protein